MSSPKGHSRACFNAKNKQCKCRCKGRFHSLGRKQVQEFVEGKDVYKPDNIITSLEKPTVVFNQEKTHVYTLDELF